jgi:hypothetical protein
MNTNNHIAHNPADKSTTVRTVIFPLSKAEIIALNIFRRVISILLQGRYADCTLLKRLFEFK